MNLTHAKEKGGYDNQTNAGYPNIRLDTLLDMATLWAALFQ